MLVYPNPAQERSTLSLELTEASDVMVRVLDLQGREVIAIPMERYLPGKLQLRWMSPTWLPATTCCRPLSTIAMPRSVSTNSDHFPHKEKPRRRQLSGFLVLAGRLLSFHRLHTGEGQRRDVVHFVIDPSFAAGRLSVKVLGPVDLDRGRSSGCRTRKDHRRDNRRFVFGELG